MYGLYLISCAFSIVLSINVNKSIVFTERLALAILFAIGITSNDNINITHPSKKNYNLNIVLIIP